MDQDYRPADIADSVYYRPTGRGADVDRRPGAAPAPTSTSGSPTPGDADERG